MVRFKARNRYALVVPLVTCLALSACASSDGSTYSKQDVGQIIETSQGQVISSRPVEIRDTESGILGAAGGGVAGGVVGSTIGGGNGSTLATLAGVLIGAGLGYLTEQEVRSGKGTEYLVEMDDGRVVTIVQNQDSDELAIPNSTPVLIQYGTNYTRIVPIEKDLDVSGKAPPSNEWQNPDLAPIEKLDSAEISGAEIQADAPVSVQ